VDELRRLPPDWLARALRLQARELVQTGRDDRDARRRPRHVADAGHRLMDEFLAELDSRTDEAL